MAPARNRARKGAERMIPSDTAPITGRTPTRSGRALTAWSVTRSEMKARTSGSSKAVVARSAKVSESKTVRSRYSDTPPTNVRTAAVTTRAFASRGRRVTPSLEPKRPTPERVGRRSYSSQVMPYSAETRA